MAADPAPYVRVLGVRVHVLTEAGLLQWIAASVDARAPRQVVTVNPEFVMRAREDPAFGQVLEHADVATPDGVGVIWAARRQKVRIAERVGGADFMLPLARQCARLGHRLFLLGGAEGVAHKAAAALREEVSGLVIAGTHSGSPAPDLDEEQVDLVRKTNADVLLVAFGCPAQDFWIARNKSRLGVPVSIGVGGTLDYLAGVQRRAPALLRRLWLDWAFRLATQPWRWRRMLALPRFAWAVIREA
ncbi:MAG: WecB/TagA/CpsF family glycosyltransferase [Chloroflexota bacterium]